MTLTSLAEWWNTGRNVRVPNESEAGWLALIKDDFRQLTLSDDAFCRGKFNLLSWRPIKAFSPRMLRTGPTPLIRQLCERSLKTLYPWRRIQQTTYLKPQDVQP